MQRAKRGGAHAQAQASDPSQLKPLDLGGASVFQIGGAHKLLQPLTVTLQAADGSAAAAVDFPCNTAASTPFQQLLQACSPASFGRGAQTVLDPAYRKALALPPERFALNMKLPTDGMLQDIQRLLKPDAQGVRADLYSLNIYGPEGFFRSHVDTPQGSSMFGSLVICLPTDFTGGELVVKGPAGGAAVKHSWGAVPLPDTLQWAAFYSDLEHEILPVNTGYRVTLTFNLHTDNSAADGTSVALQLPAGASVDAVHKTAFGQQLQAVLQDPTWHPKGVTLGFALDHKYPSRIDARGPPSDLDDDMEGMFGDALMGEEVGPSLLAINLQPSILKGSDLMLHHLVSQLGLPCRLMPIIQVKRGDYDDDEEEGGSPPAMPGSVLLAEELGKAAQRALEAEAQAKQKYGKDWWMDARDPEEGTMWWHDDATEVEFLNQRHGAKKATGVVWVKPPRRHNWYYEDSTQAYGNSGHVEEWYVGAALLVDVPESGAGARPCIIE